MSKFKVGDRVRCVRGSTAGFPTDVRTGEEYTVSAIGPMSVQVQRADGTTTGGWDCSRFELVETPSFKVGDTVRLRNQTSYKGSWAGDMVVEQVFDFGSTNCRHPKNGSGGFRNDELIAAPAKPKRLKVLEREAAEATIAVGAARSAKADAEAAYDAARAAVKEAEAAERAALAALQARYDERLKAAAE